MEDMQLGSSTQVAGDAEAYVITSDAGDIVDRPILRLNPSEQNLVRSFENATAFKESPSLVERFVKSTGVVEGRDGQPRKATFRALAWLVGLKSQSNAKGSTLVAFERDENGAVTGDALAVREYTIVPSTDLHDEEVLKQYNQDGIIRFRVVPLISLTEKAPVLKSGAVDLKKVKAGNVYPVDRLPFKNVVMVDYTKEADGTVIPVRVRSTFYLRTQFLDRNNKISVEASDGRTVTRPARLHASVTPRNMYDVTDEFLDAYAKVEGKTTDEKVQAAIQSCFGGKGRLAQCLELQARSAAAAMVSGIAYNVRRQYQLDDRIRMYAFTGHDAYFGIENSALGTDNEFTDFHIRLSSLEDPLVMNAQRLEGVRRINAGTKIVLSE